MQRWDNFKQQRQDTLNKYIDHLKFGMMRKNFMA